MRMISVVEFLHPVDDLSFTKSAVPDRCSDGIPVPESVLLEHRVHILRNHYLGRINAVILTVCKQQFTAFLDIIILKFVFEPLIYLGLGLIRLDEIEPVPARSS